MSANGTHECLRNNAKNLLHNVEILLRDLDGDLLPQIQGTLDDLARQSREISKTQAIMLKVERTEHGYGVMNATSDIEEETGGDRKEKPQGAGHLSPGKTACDGAELGQNGKRTPSDSGTESAQ